MKSRGCEAAVHYFAQKLDFRLLMSCRRVDSLLYCTMGVSVAAVFAVYPSAPQMKKKIPQSMLHDSFLNVKEF